MRPDQPPSSVPLGEGPNPQTSELLTEGGASGGLSVQQASEARRHAKRQQAFAPDRDRNSAYSYAQVVQMSPAGTQFTVSLCPREELWAPSQGILGHARWTSCDLSSLMGEGGVACHLPFSAASPRPRPARLCSCSWLHKLRVSETCP